MADETDRRIRLLEEKFAFQEKTIDALNEVVIDQQAQLDILREQLRVMREMVMAAQQSPYSPFGGDEPPPPHY